MYNFDCAVLNCSRSHFLENGMFKEKNLAEAIHVVKRILSASTIARREGLLALEEYANQLILSNTEADNFLKLAILLIVDGTDPEFVRNILENKIVVRGMDTLEGFLYYIMMEGALSIQAGVNPRIIEMVMYSYFPEEAADKISRAVKEEQEEFTEEHKQYLVQKLHDLKPEYTDNPFLTQFEKQILLYGDQGIQRILREMYKDEMAVLLKFCSTEVKDAMLRNISNNLKALLMDDMWFASEADLTAALEKILRVIAKLEDSGEIVGRRTVDAGVNILEQWNI